MTKTLLKAMFSPNTTTNSTTIKSSLHMKMKFDTSCGQSVTSHKRLSPAWFLNGTIMYFKILSAANFRLHLKGILKGIKFDAKKRLKKLHLKIPSAAYIY